VIAEIIEHGKHTPLDRKLLFITHSALMLLHFYRRCDWHLVLARCPSKCYWDKAISGAGGETVKDRIMRSTVSGPRVLIQRPW
jgi:hypothetical protein